MTTKKMPSGFSEAWEVVKTLELLGLNRRTYRLEVRRSLDPEDAEQPYGTVCWVEDEDDDGRIFYRTVAAGLVFPAATAEEAQSVAVSGLGINESRVEDED